jgi:hypothetical protein
MATAKFFASWDAKYFSEGGTASHTLAWFNSDRGYKSSDKAKIKKLRVGQSVEIDKGHRIARTS